MVVYLDIIWVLNLMVDSLLLWLTAIFLKRTIHLGRVFLGGLLGSMLIVLAITPISNWAGHPLVKIGVSIGMILIVFGYKRMKYFLSGLLTFYFATFLMGGIIIGTHYFLAFDLQLKSVVFHGKYSGFWGSNQLGVCYGSLSSGVAFFTKENGWIHDCQRSNTMY